MEEERYEEKERKKMLCAARLGDLTFFFVPRHTLVIHVAAAAVFSRNNGRSRARLQRTDKKKRFRNVLFIVCARRQK